MLKQLFLVSAIVAVSTSASAYSYPYLGAGIGVINNSANLKTNGISDQTIGAYRGLPFNLYAGYGGLMSPSFYLAGEINGTVGTANISEDNNAGLKTSYGIGASIIPGVMLSDRTLAYGRAGVLRSRFPSGDAKTRNGGQFGLGMQTSLAQHVDLRGEYTFVAYEAKKNVFGSAATRSDQFSVGLIYKFD